MRGGNAADAPPLDQPADAVPLRSMSQPTEVPAESAPEQSSEAVASSSAEPPQLTVSTGQELQTEGKGKARDETPQPPSKDRTDSGLAIGAAQDDITVISPDGTDPAFTITLLLASGSRHPYRIDAKYLARRNVTIPSENDAGLPDPFSISVYTLKELILREWRSDWEAKPSSPSSIRLIHFGKMLDDSHALTRYQFSAGVPNVVHMSIRPQDLDEEEPKGGTKNVSNNGANGNNTRSGGCCIIL
jgi:hypothetical protein